VWCLSGVPQYFDGTTTHSLAFLDSNVATASKWANARTLTLTGDATGSGSIDGSGNVSIAMTGVQAAKWTTTRTETCGGDLSGSASVSGAANWTLSCTVTAASTSTAGKVALATNAQALGGTDSTHAVTSAALASGCALGTPGYCTFPGGLIHQWGYTGAGAVGASSSLTISFPKGCGAAAYSVVATTDTGGTNAWHMGTIGSSGFTIFNDKSGAAGFYWMADCTS
jgi:hypothetical protein